MLNSKINRKIFFLSLLSIILILGFIFLGVNEKNFDYFMYRRVPKILAIVITGIAISISSVVFQTISNNRILTPSVLGLDSLYLLVQTVIIFFFSSDGAMVSNKNLNFIISVGLMLVFSSILYKFIFKKEQSNLMTLLLIGMIFGTLFRSFSSFLQVVIDPNEYLHVQGKMFASFNNVNTNILVISSCMVIGVIIFTYFKANILDVLALGRDQSINLGINYHKILTALLFSVSILISVSTALVGPITFLGFLAANVAREMIKTYEHKYLLTSACLISIIALVGGQFLAERIFNFTTPISVIINFVGGVYFIKLLLKENVT